MKRPREASLKRQLQALVLAVLLPAALLGAASTTYVYREERDAYRRSVQDTVDAMALVVDKEIGRREELLRALAASPLLDAPDLAAFHRYAKRIAPQTDHTIVLSDLQGQQLLNTRRSYPPEVPLPRTDIFTALRRQAGPQAILVSDLYRSPLTGQPSFAVQVPVLRDGQVRHYLAMGSFATQMQKVFGERGLRPHWTAALLDREGVIVARNIDPHRHVGQQARGDLLDAVRRGTRGFFDTQTRDGRPVTAFFSRTPAARRALAASLPWRASR